MPRFGHDVTRKPCGPLAESALADLHDLRQGFSPPEAGQQNAYSGGDSVQSTACENIKNGFPLTMREANHAGFVVTVENNRI